MSTRYLSILAIQSPFDVGPDENNRNEFSFNVQAIAEYPVDKWTDELGKLLQDNSLGTLGTSIFVGRKVTLPSGDGPYTRIINTGGTSPLEAHGGEKYERLSAQVITTGKSYMQTQTRIQAIFALLDGRRQVTLAA